MKESLYAAGLLVYNPSSNTRVGGGFGDPISPHQALKDGRLRFETRLKFCPHVLRVKIMK